RQHLVVVAGGLGEQVLDPAPLGEAVELGSELGVLAAGERHAGLVGEGVQGVPEAHAVARHHVVDAVAAVARAAGEVAPGLAVGPDDEGRVAVGAERRAPLEDRARRLQLDVPPDERGEVDAVADAVDDGAEVVQAASLASTEIGVTAPRTLRYARR